MSKHLLPVILSSMLCSNQQEPQLSTTHLNFGLQDGKTDFNSIGNAIKETPTQLENSLLTIQCKFGVCRMATPTWTASVIPSRRPRNARTLVAVDIPQHAMLNSAVTLNSNHSLTSCLTLAGR